MKRKTGEAKITITQTDAREWVVEEKKMNPDSTIEISIEQAERVLASFETGELKDEETYRFARPMVNLIPDEELDGTAAENVAAVTDMVDAVHQDADGNSIARSRQLDIWLETLNLDDVHWLLADGKTTAVFLPFEKYDSVPTKYQKYMAVVYPKAEYRSGQDLKVYIARTEKAREMWGNFTTKNPTAKKVDAIGIHQNGGLTDTSSDWNVDVTTTWYTMITEAIRKRMKEFASASPMARRRRPTF